MRGLCQTPDYHAPVYDAQRLGRNCRQQWGRRARPDGVELGRLWAKEGRRRSHRPGLFRYAGEWVMASMQAVLFDFGGVLVRTQSWERRLAWDARLGLAPGSVEELVFNSEHGRAAQLGLFTEAAHWVWVGKTIGLSSEQLSELRRDFWAEDRLDVALMAFIRRLKRHYAIGLISNAMDGLRAELARLGIADVFDEVVISAEFGRLKPDPAIYQHTLRLLDCPPECAVFIDDFARNVQGARAVGLAAIHFTPELDLVAELARLGVAPHTLG